MNNTAVLALFLCIFAVTTQQNVRPAVQKAQEHCRKQTGVSHEALERAKRKDLQVDDRKLQCYTKCILQTVQAMDDKGNLDMTKFIEGMEPKAKAAYRPMMLYCQDEVGNVEKDLCKKGMQMYQCMLKKSGDKYLFI